ncbi:hypothetical protein FQA39_LY02522 [Lamprigera yunnana]|nr:hypothetical protein FQA39_LY02522 [Lamprigera yunnana]
MLHNDEIKDDDEVCSINQCYEFVHKDGTDILSTKQFVPCKKSKCIRNKSCHLPPLVLPSRKLIEVSEVQALPSDWVTVSKPSILIENLNKKRQQRQEQVKAEVLERCQNINYIIEVQIRTKSERLKEALYSNKDEVQKLLNTFEIIPEKISTFDKDAFELAKNYTLEMLENNKFLINQFYNFLKNLEKSRTQSYKELLRYEYKELHNISYQLPYEIENYFESKILGINQIVLSNLRWYADLRYNLLFQVENDNRLNMQSINGVYSSWTHLKEDSRLKLNEMKLLHSDSECIAYESEPAQKTSKMILDTVDATDEMLQTPLSLPLSETEIEMWLKEAQNTINSLNLYAQKLIALYKLAVMHMFNGYFEELQDVCNKLDKIDVESEELNMLNLQICEPAIECATKRYSEDFSSLKDEWDLVITKLNQKLQQTYVFLKLVGRLWDNHFERLNSSKDLVLRDLNNMVQNDDKWQSVNEMELAIAIDTLRQAPSREQLEVLLQNAFKKIDALEKVYHAQYTEETLIVNKYENMVGMETNLLVAELEQILRKYKINSNPQSIKDIQTTVSDEPSEDSTEAKSTEKNFLFLQMKQCEFQIDAAQNWMMGLQQEIKSYIVTCKQDHNKQAVAWILDNNKKLAKRFTIKLALNQSKYERIKSEVYNLRLAELKIHTERFDRHKEGAEKEIQNIKNYFLSSTIKYNITVDEFKKKVNELYVKREKASNIAQVKLIIRSLNYNSNLFKKQINTLMNKMEEMYDSKMKKIKKSSIKFCENMKLFGEDGNFHADEAKNMSKELVKHEKELKKKLNNIKKEVKKDQLSLEKEVKLQEAKLLPILTQSLEEFQFNKMIETIIQNIQVDLKTITYNLKFSMTKSESSFQDLRDLKQSNLGNLKSLVEFENKYKSTFEAYLTLQNSLYQKEPFKKLIILMWFAAVLIHTTA